MLAEEFKPFSTRLFTEQLLGNVEGSSLEFWVLLPTIMMCNQLVSVKCISAMAWGWDTSLVPRSSLRLPTHTVSCCSHLLLGQCRYRRGGWGSPWPQPEGPVWQETSPPSGYAHLGYELGLHCCFVRPGSGRSWPRLPKGSGLQALSSVSGQLKAMRPKSPDFLCLWQQDTLWLTSGLF